MPKVFLTATQRAMEREAYRQEQFNSVLLNRKAKGMDHQVLASVIGVTSTTLSKWKNDSGKMSLDNFRKLADVVQMTDEEILRVVKGKT